jgi:hypothetical protein
MAIVEKLKLLLNYSFHVRQKDSLINEPLNMLFTFFEVFQCIDV